MNFHIKILTIFDTEKEPALVIRACKSIIQSGHCKLANPPVFHLRNSYNVQCEKTVAI